MNIDDQIDDGWISIHDKSRKMPIRKNFYVKFDNGEIHLSPTTNYYLKL